MIVKEWRMADGAESAEDPGRVFHWVRVSKPGDIPKTDSRIMDIAILDMHHSWPNLGHDSLVRAVGEIAGDLSPLLDLAGMAIRVVSFDVRQGLVIPDSPGERFMLYLGTGGPGHIDPRFNDGTSEGTQGICENPSWELPLFRLFDSIARHPDAALLAVCHTFGVLCRWAGAAQAVLRGPEKGGKSSGIVENILTREAVRHPWFSRFASQIPDGRHFKVLDSRLYDLIPVSRRFPDGMMPIAFEPEAPGGEEGNALTMMEFARDAGGVMPRILAVNHHPEVRNRGRQLRLLGEKLARGEVTAAWYKERAETLKEVILSRPIELAVMLTSQYTLLAPLRFHIYRQVRRRSAALGCGSDLHENQVLRFPSCTLDREAEVHF